VRERAGRVEGKVAIVTGAGSTPGEGVGTGKAIAITLAREGAKVLLVDLYPERAEDTLRIIKEEGGEAAIFKADCTKWRDCGNMVMKALELWGTVDILVNNLGLASFGSAVELGEREWDRTFDINLRTVFLCSKYTLPVMIARGSGCIVNMSSISSRRGGRTLAYTASKAAVEAMTFDMAAAHGPQGIRVNCVMPGSITTPVASNVVKALPDPDEVDEMRLMSSMLGVPGDAWDIANATLFLASDEARWITGITLPVEAGSLGLGASARAAQIREMHERRKAKKGA